MKAIDARRDDAHIAAAGADRVAQARIEIGRRQEGVVEPALDDPGDGEAAPKSRAAIRIDDREIVTSPTLKPKNTALKEPVTSVEFDAPRRQDQQEHEDDESEARGAAAQYADLLEGAAAEARIGLERRREPGLAAQGAADELVGESDAQNQSATKMEIRRACSTRKEARAT